jgi:hypothetical protein
MNNIDEHLIVIIQLVPQVRVRFLDANLGWGTLSLTRLGFVFLNSVPPARFRRFLVWC